jgi:DNA-binding transcriptional regulator YiaG
MQWTGRMVRELRERHGESQREFAIRLQVSTATVQFWEQGRNGDRGPNGAACLLLDRIKEDIDAGQVRSVEGMTPVTKKAVSRTN